MTYDTIEAHMHFDAYTDDWSEFGGKLMSFPKNPADSVVFEAGIDSSGYDFLVLKAYCYDAAGHAAVSVLLDNNQDLPRRCRLEFSIPADAASINLLGSMLYNWKVEHSSELLWEAQIS
ncbi:hypothetical protein LJY25_11050 [Hymenobacter sp. BT175]|uniref:hypothetical protein n=1 Tax=Hymenobacter translucens TaxID=2886507 RepID=UPI001D0EF30D|nr:hypothetical protein [Hymenobacter translucens]MCC2546984.1 hypothetical protein [Hymenobacter translucens]